MINQEIIDSITAYVASSEGNYVPERLAIEPRVAGMKMFELPLVGFASATDSLFIEEYKKPGVVHPEYITPTEWLPGAKTVISFFVPFTDVVKKSNLKAKDIPYEEGLNQLCSIEWLHARIEGQAFVNTITDLIQKVLEAAGYRSVCPTTSERYRLITPYISVWSERHAAYAAGLGTFGLSKGLITEKGMCGRFGSVITDAEFVPTVRPYTSPFEYCTMCGACAKRCPVNAIDPAKGCALGKDQNICGPTVRAGRLPAQGVDKIIRYGCGKCQTGVPCESRIPRR